MLIFIFIRCRFQPFLAEELLDPVQRLFELAFAGDHELVEFLIGVGDSFAEGFQFFQEQIPLLLEETKE